MPLTLSGSNGVAGVDGSAGTPALQGSDSNTGIAFGADTIIGSTGGSERFRCDSSGRLLVGATTARTNFSNSTDDPQLQIESTNGFGWASIRNSNSSGGAYVYIAKSRGTGNVIVQNNDIIGGLNFEGNDGSEFVTAAQIRTEVDGTPGANDMPGRIVLSTTADGASSPTERMRIASDGAVFIAKTGYASGTVGIELQPTGSVYATRDGNICGLWNRLTSDGSIITIQRSSSTVGSISVTTTATAYNTSSDYRLKENVVAVTDGITRLQQLKPSRFNFIADPDKIVDGFIAHEVQAVVPEAISGEKNAVDEDGNPVYQGIDQSKLVPLLTAALQEAIVKIESLETRLAALEVTP